MKGFLRIAAVAAVILCSSTLVARAAEAIKWKTSMATAKADSKRLHRLILVDFYADW